MASVTRRKAYVFGLILLLVGCGVGLVSLGSGGPPSKASAQSHEPTTPSAHSFLSEFDPREHRRDGERLVTDLENGSVAVLTVDPNLQEHVESVFDRYDVPFGSVVALEPDTGRVLAYVSHSSASPGAPDLALDPTPPTASVFKLVTAAALVDAGVEGDSSVCYHGGGSRLFLSNLEDSERDRQCSTLSEAVGSSINCVFAKLSDRNLDAPTLTRYASAFGFGHALPFDVPTQISPSDVPDHDADRLEFARTSAGFWHMHMSPLHGALIASVFANDGQMPRAAIVDRIMSAQGAELYRHEPMVYRRVISRRTAREVGAMMERTVTHGTARRSFFDPQGRAFLPGVRVAGKTGTLSGESPYRGYTWWVGYAPADDPQIAVAALVVNTPRWRIKASYVARETLREYLVR